MSSQLHPPHDVCLSILNRHIEAVMFSLVLHARRGWRPYVSLSRECQLTHSIQNKSFITSVCTLHTVSPWTSLTTKQKPGGITASWGEPTSDRSGSITVTVTRQAGVEYVHQTNVWVYCTPHAKFLRKSRSACRSFVWAVSLNHCS